MFWELLRRRTSSLRFVPLGGKQRDRRDNCICILPQLLNRCVNFIRLLSCHITVRVEGGSEETLWEDQKRGHLHPQAGRGADSASARWAQVSDERKAEGMGDTGRLVAITWGDFYLFGPFLFQACSGYPRALWKEAGEGQQPLHGAKCHHAAAGGPGEGTHEVRQESCPLKSINCVSAALLFLPFFHHGELLPLRK